jgi:tetratricopeptide (TPR) repeat protein
MTRTRAIPKVQLMSARSARPVILLAACLLLLAGPSVIARASANEIAEALAQCQDEDKATELRARACTFLITTRSIEDNIRAEALLNRGTVQFEAGDTDAAIVDFTEAIRLNPQYPAPYSHRAEAYQEKGQLDLALADLTTVIGLLPDDADSYVDRGEVHALLGNHDSAVADFRTALKLDPHNDQAREGLRSLGER